MRKIIFRTQISLLNWERKHIKLAQVGFHCLIPSTDPWVFVRSLTQKWKPIKVTFKNEFYLFGGRTEDRQVSKLESCSVKKLFDLPFDFQFGACGTYSDNEAGLKKCVVTAIRWTFWTFEGFCPALLWKKSMERLSKVRFDLSHP